MIFVNPSTHGQRTLQRDRRRQRIRGIRRTDRGKRIRGIRNRPDCRTLGAIGDGRSGQNRWPAEGLLGRTGRRCVVSFLKIILLTFGLAYGVAIAKERILHDQWERFSEAKHCGRLDETNLSELISACCLFS